MKFIFILLGMKIAWRYNFNGKPDAIYFINKVLEQGASFEFPYKFWLFVSYDFFCNEDTFHGWDLMRTILRQHFLSLESTVKLKVDWNNWI